MDKDFWIQIGFSFAAFIVFLFFAESVINYYDGKHKNSHYPTCMCIGTIPVLIDPGKE